MKRTPERTFSQQLRARLWDFTAPALWTLVFLLGFAVAGHIWSGRLPAPLLRAVPALAEMAPDCGKYIGDPLTPANGSRLLGATKATPDMVLVFVHGYHGTPAAWAIPIQGLDYELKQKQKSALVYFPCYPSQDEASLDQGAAAIAALHAVEQAQPGQEIFFIGHSFGGLVIKRYLADHASAFDPNPIHVVTINTPHHGSPASVLGYMTGEPLLSKWLPVSPKLQVFPGLARSAKLETLNDDPALAPFRFYTITGTYVASPVSAFLGGTFIAQSDGVVPARSAHLVIPSELVQEPKTYLDGLPYSCGIADRGAGAPAEWQFTFTRPLHQVDIFHKNIPDSPTVQRILLRVLDNPDSLSTTFSQCDPVTPYILADHRTRAYVLLAVPLILLLVGARWLTRYLKEAGQGTMTVFYALAASLCTYIFSYFVPLGMYVILPVSASLSGVWLAYIQAIIEEAILMAWFAYFLRQNLDREQYEEKESFQYALLFGLTIAMVEQTIFVWSTGGTEPGATVVRLVLASLPRIGFVWMTAWVLFQRHRLARLARLPAVAHHRRILWLTRLCLLALPPGLHTLYSALFFNVTSMYDAVALYVVMLVAAATFAATSVLRKHWRRFDKSA